MIKNDMIDKTWIHPDEKKNTSWTDKMVLSATSDINDVLNFFNLTIMDDPDAEILFKTHIKDALVVAKENKEILDGSHLIYVENTRGWRKRSDFGGIDDAREILSKTPEAKIVLLGMFPIEMLRKQKNTCDFVMAHPNVVFVDILHASEELRNVQFRGIIDQEKYLASADKLAKEKMLHIRHILQGIKDPYHPEDENEKNRIESAFKETQEYFPGLDTIDKMLDFVIHVNIDIPEKMKGEEIDGVYCDVDGTLIEYVGIHSGKEGTQQLRQSVVELLKKYEQEGKKIYIRTWGNVEKKTAYLRKLGITWPVLNKYDYAGATAEIVIDDTDQNAFIVQSKILPKTYIDTKDWK